MLGEGTRTRAWSILEIYKSHLLWKRGEWFQGDKTKSSSSLHKKLDKSAFTTVLVGGEVDVHCLRMALLAAIKQVVGQGLLRWMTRSCNFGRTWEGLSR